MIVMFLPILEHSTHLSEDTCTCVVIVNIDPNECIFWLCKMRDLKLQPDRHTVKHFHKMGLYFPGVDEPFWTTDFGMPFDPRRHGGPVKHKHTCLL